MSAIAFDPAAFRAQFPEFSVTPPNTDAILGSYFSIASTIISNQDNACYLLSGDARAQALNYLTAHIAKIARQLAAGETPGQERSASIDKIRVEVTPPPNQSQFEWWLGCTGYGAFVLVILQANSVGGLWVGVGASERSAFRKAGGFF